MTDNVEGRAIARGAGLSAAGTLVSRVLGVVRDMTLAASFSVATTDAWIVAFTIPNTLRGVLAEGGVSAALLPTYARVQREEGEPEAARFTADFTLAMAILLTIVAGLGALFAVPIVTAFAGGYDATRFDLTVRLTRLTFPYLIFVGLGAIGAGALNAKGRFFLASVAPALLNVGLVMAALFLAPMLAHGSDEGAMALAFGALAGGLAGVLVQLPALARQKLLVLPKRGLASPHVKRALKLLLPLMVGLGVSQTHVALSRFFASQLPEGAPSYLYYGARLIEIPQGMFAIAIASATLPALARLEAAGQRDEFLAVLRQSLKLTLFISIPASALLIVLAEPIVAVVFGRGDFGRAEVLETSHSLAFQALGVAATAMARLIAPAFHALSDTRTPVVAAFVGLVAFLGLSVALIGSFGHVGIACAVSGAAFVQLTTSAVLFRRRAGALGVREIGKSLLVTVIATAGAAGTAYGVCRLGHFETGGNDLVNIAVLAGAMIAAIVVFLVTAKVFRSAELESLRVRVRR